jgi:hypothetical protein
MNELTPTEIKENPELATLALLDAALLMTSLSLIALYPSSYGDDSDLEGNELSAYADAIIIQINTVEGMIDCYRKSLKRSRRAFLEGPRECEEEFCALEIPL